jgi:hypothetical protein
LKIPALWRVPLTDAPELDAIIGVARNESFGRFADLNDNEKSENRASPF